MKLFFLFIFLLTFHPDLHAQKQPMDEMYIFRNDSAYTENPYLDSIKIEYDKLGDALISWEECPEYFFIGSNGDTTLLSTKFSPKNLQEGALAYTAYCQITVDWQAIIRSIKIIKYTGNIDRETLKKQFHGLMAKKLTRFGFPIGSKCVVRVFKRKK